MYQKIYNLIYIYIHIDKCDYENIIAGNYQQTKERSKSNNANNNSADLVFILQWWSLYRPPRSHAHLTNKRPRQTLETRPH